jgi:CelD/BcsL family acetyltransferase involved in cellulose biosynthesis
VSVPVALRVLRTTAELEALTPRWIELWLSNAHARPFQHPAWLLPWWHQFGQPGLRAVTLWNGSELIALVPLYISSEPVSGLRQLLLIGAGTSDYLDGIFSPACSPEQVLAALETLGPEDDWDIASFTQLLPHSPLFQALRQLDDDIANSYAGESCSRRSAVTIADLPRKVCADVRYFSNYARGSGRLELAIADEVSWSEMFEALVDLHTERWQQAGEPGVLADPAVLAWQREAIPRLEASGLLRLLALRVNGKPFAVLYSLIDPPCRAERTQYFYLTGFSLSHAKLKPGTILTGRAIEHAAHEGVRTIDMLRGDDSYKKFWHIERVPTYGYTVRRDRLPTATRSLSAAT